MGLRPARGALRRDADSGKLLAELERIGPQAEATRS
jgi:hypothetical protein